jgi:hypothetical protein
VLARTDGAIPGTGLTPSPHPLTHQWPGAFWLGSHEMKTVIVGGVAAGGSTGARLRPLDESHEIVTCSRDRYVSFANCGLPYHIDGTIRNRDTLLLQTPRA